MEKTNKFTKKPKKKTNDTKFHINNEIIQAQGKFKQAKIGTIRKLVEKLKHPEKNPKQNRANKVERYQNVLNHIKHMSPKRLGLLALIYYKSGKNYLADQNSTIEQLTVGYYSEAKGLNVLLDSIRTKLKLTENSKWRQSVKKLFKKKDNNKKEEKTTKNASFTESDNTDLNSEQKHKAKKSKQKVDTNGKPDKSTKALKQQQQKKTTPKQSTKEKVNEDDESNESEGENDDDGVDSGNGITATPTTVDDFFITADGSNYLSTAVVSQKQEEDSDDDSTGQRGKSFERKPRESSFFHKSDKKPVKLGSNRPESLKRKWSDDGEELAQKEKQKTIDPALHPSWQAKQKLKPTITEFKGKKITFD